MKKTIPAIIVLSFLFVFYFYGIRSFVIKPKAVPQIKTLTPERLPPVQRPIFEKAPDFALNDLAGNKIALSDFKGKVIILDFWASWCPPCREEIPHFIELYNKYKEKGLEIVGVALDARGSSVVKPFSERVGINYIVLIGNRAVTDLYGGIFSIPTAYVIDKEGRIREKYIGYRDKEVFEADIKELL